VWLRFKGGKGVATYLGVLLGLYPFGALMFAALWIVFLLASRISSAGGIAAACMAPLAAVVQERWDLLPLLLGLTVLVLWKHRENIARLRAGTEPTIGRNKE
jgi:glycerol-3-phosphate acyltransferase PlsY